MSTPAYICSECGTTWDQGMKAEESAKAMTCQGSIVPFVIERFRAAQIGNAKPADAGGNTHGKEGA